jgi:hypothetical protein
MRTAIREQVDALLRPGVIEVSHAPIWSQVHIVPKSDGKWRFALDFIRLIRVYAQKCFCAFNLRFQICCFKNKNVYVQTYCCFIYAASVLF